MDTMKNTVTEDALGKDAKHSASATDTFEVNSSEKLDDETSFEAGKDQKGKGEDTEDLLKKIEKVVKDKNTVDSMDNDISQSSEHEFIKKLEEIEKEDKVVRHGENSNMDGGCKAEQVIVGKLIMEVSADEKIENSTSNNSNIEKCNNDVSSTTENISESGASKTKETDLKTASANLAEKIKSVGGECSIMEESGVETNLEKHSEDTKAIKNSSPSKENSVTSTNNLPSISKETNDERDKTTEIIDNAKISSVTPEDISENVKVTSVSETLVTKVSQTLIAPEKSLEQMSVDLFDPLSEPMEVDPEEKMDVDSENVSETNDDEMVPVEDISTAENKISTKPEVSSNSALPIQSSKEEVVKVVVPMKENVNAPGKSDSSVSEIAAKGQRPNTEGAPESQIRKTIDLQKHQKSDSSENLPICKSPIAKMSTASINTANISEIRAPMKSEITVTFKPEHKKDSERNLPVSEPSVKVTLEVFQKETSCSVDGLVPSKEHQVAEGQAVVESPTKMSKEDRKANDSSKEYNSDSKVATVNETQSSIERITVKNKSEENQDKVSTTKEIECEKKQEKSKVGYTEPIQKDLNKSEGMRGKGSEEEKGISKDTSPKSPQTETRMLPDVKNQGSSDSTASLSSTTDEQIIKFSIQTTLPVGKELESDQLPKKIENKPLLNTMKHGGSTPSLNTTPVTAANVFNSTPIQKQFEISSENVSKISEAETIETSATEKNVEDDANINKLRKPEYSSESVTCTSTDHTSSGEHHSSDHQESEDQSSDEIKKYMNAIKKYNGITDSINDDDDEKVINIKTGHSARLELITSTTGSDLKKDSLYNINVWYDNNDLTYLSVEKLDSKKLSTILRDKTSDGLEQGSSSSNGSVTSLPPFNLPSIRLAEASFSSSSSQKTEGKQNASSQIKKSKFTIQGMYGLCNFMIEEFTKIKTFIHPEEVITPKESMKIDAEPTTPKSKSKELIKKNLTKGKSSSPVVSESSPSPVVNEKRSRKRSYNKSLSEEDEDDGKSKAKQPRKAPPKSQGTPSKEIESTHCDLAGQCVLAKWIDKKYYAGKITGDKPGNKFIVLFEDGATKILPRESIVFGEGDTLPLKDRSVHALVDDDFEIGICLSVDKVDEKILYTVKAETKTVQVSASDIYLQDDQAKAIQGVKIAQKRSSSTTSPEDSTTGSSRPSRNKRASASPVIPEPGYSGGVGKKGAKRQKRTSVSVSQLNRISESDISDTQESSPTSPETTLELLIEGVQPELQRTDKEAELCKMIFIADYLEHDPVCNPKELLGQLPVSKTMFKNKSFILTCSVGLKPHRYVDVDESNVNNKNRQFSKVPFVKNFLQKQIEEGGGKVYNNFEDIPKNKYRQCKLIAPRPCTTARYIQCLAADIQVVSHEWIINSCNKNVLQDIKKYVLPSGWSILTETFIRWAVGKAPDQRQSGQAFNKTNILIASEHKDFITFWSRVCRLAGATIRYIKYINDVTPSTKGYMVTDLHFPPHITAKASHFEIPIVSTVWIVESLILGKICPPDSSPKLTEMYPDDD